MVEVNGRRGAVSDVSGRVLGRISSRVDGVIVQVPKSLKPLGKSADAQFAPEEREHQSEGDDRSARGRCSALSEPGVDVNDHHSPAIKYFRSTMSFSRKSEGGR